MSANRIDCKLVPLLVEEALVKLPMQQVAFVPAPKTNNYYGFRPALLLKTQEKEKWRTENSLSVLQRTYREEFVTQKPIKRDSHDVSVVTFLLTLFALFLHPRLNTKTITTTGNVSNQHHSDSHSMVSIFGFCWCPENVKLLLGKNG